jgi:NTP pyrophosphatase (non-canonical NTP hydrolase)
MREVARPGMSEQVREHHEKWFGRLSMCRIAAKLGEEAGELQGAIIRDTERRDGRSWQPEIRHELRDVLIVLHVIASRMGKDLVEMAEDGRDYFVSSEFHNIERLADEQDSQVGQAGD